MAEEQVTKISKVRNVSRSVESFQKILEKHAPNREHFETLMQRTEPVKTETIAKDARPAEVGAKPTLMDEVSRLNSKVEGLSKRTSEDLIVEAQSARRQIAQIQDQLQQPELQMRDSVQTLLKSKLNNIQENLQVALNRAGVDSLPPEPGAPGGNPITRFMDLLSNGQHNLERLSGHIETMAAQGKEVAPADLLVVQLKVHHVQEQLEFFTNLLNKALESTKTMMNVQV